MITIFSKVKSELGEGPLWHPRRNSLLWLDINKCKLYERYLTSSDESYDACWELPEIGSAVALDQENNDSIYIVTDKSFASFDLNKGLFESKVELNLPNGIRANDGGVSPNGTFWFGTMEKKPTGRNGAIYSIDSSGKVREQLTGIGIPNTMAWSNDGKTLFLSDSWVQKTYSFDVANGSLIPSSQKEIVNLQNNHSTPDGGATDIDGNVWIAHWDGFKLVCINPNGDVLKELTVPVPKPTSCCFGGKDNKFLFITSAREGMTPKELDEYSLSGSVFVIESDNLGTEVPAFSLGF
jgi:sugar lactone lactonase YvrE